MNEHILAEALEWLEEKTKPLFVLAALILYALEVYRITRVISPVEQLDAFLIESLAALSIPFGIILLQEMLELVTRISESNLISARRQFEIVILVIIRSFFKNFAKVNGYVDDGIFSPVVIEAIVKVGAILALIVLIHLFRVMAEGQGLDWYAGQGERTNLYKQALVVILVISAIVYQLFFDPTAVFGTFDEFRFIRLVFTGLIVIESLFLILSIAKSNFGRLILESCLVIALIFARFPLFASNTLSYILCIIGVAFATGSLYLFSEISKWVRENRPNMYQPEPQPHTASDAG
ncbi:MAG: hypothetical protein AAF485_04580 [Chloroflexota bacterium]